MSRMNERQLFKLNDWQNNLITKRHVGLCDASATMLLFSNCRALVGLYDIRPCNQAYKYVPQYR